MPKKDAKTEKAENEARISEGQLAPFLEKIAPNLMKFMRERGLKPAISWEGPGVSYPNAGYVFKNEELKARDKR
jgi:hypothetical protein